MAVALAVLAQALVASVAVVPVAEAASAVVPVAEAEASAARADSKENKEGSRWDLPFRFTLQCYSSKRNN